MKGDIVPGNLIRNSVICLFVKPGAFARIVVIAILLGLVHANHRAFHSHTSFGSANHHVVKGKGSLLIGVFREYEFHVYDENRPTPCADQLRIGDRFLFAAGERGKN